MGSTRDNIGSAAIVSGTIVVASDGEIIGCLGENGCSLTASVLARVAVWVGESTTTAANETFNVFGVLFVCFLFTERRVKQVNNIDLGILEVVM